MINLQSIENIKITLNKKKVVISDESLNTMIELCNNNGITDDDLTDWLESMNLDEVIYKDKYLIKSLSNAISENKIVHKEAKNNVPIVVLATMQKLRDNKVDVVGKDAIELDVLINELDLGDSATEFIDVIDKTIQFVINENIDLSYSHFIETLYKTKYIKQKNINRDEIKKEVETQIKEWNEIWNEL